MRSVGQVKEKNSVVPWAEQKVGVVCGAGKRVKAQMG